VLLFFVRLAYTSIVNDSIPPGRLLSTVLQLWLPTQLAIVKAVAKQLETTFFRQFFVHWRPHHMKDIVKAQKEGKVEL